MGERVEVELWKSKSESNLMSEEEKGMTLEVWMHDYDM